MSKKIYSVGSPVDEDLYDVSIAKELHFEMEFDEALDNGNIEKCRQMIDQMAELNPTHSKILEAELLDAPLSNFIK